MEAQRLHHQRLQLVLETQSGMTVSSTSSLEKVEKGKAKYFDMSTPPRGGHLAATRQIVVAPSPGSDIIGHPSGLPSTCVVVGMHGAACSRVNLDNEPERRNNSCPHFGDSKPTDDSSQRESHARAAPV